MVGFQGSAFLGAASPCRICQLRLGRCKTYSATLAVYRRPDAQDVSDRFSAPSNAPVNMAERAPTRRPVRGTPPGPRRKPPPDRAPVLSRGDVVNKQVITRVSGRQLGIISHLYVDPRSMRVVSMDLRPKGVAMGPKANLLLSTLCQIGDVVLVHNEDALDLPPLTERQGCIRLTGCDVQAHDGTCLGKVREYSFNPDTGNIDVIKYDSLGQPRIPESVMTVWEIGAEMVQSANPGFLVLYPRAEEQAMVISDGLVGQMFRSLQGLLSNDPGLLGGEVVDPAFEEWRRVHGRVYADYYGLQMLTKSMATVLGQEIPATRREADAVMQRAVRALPPPSQASFSDRVEVGARRPACVPIDSRAPETPRRPAYSPAMRDYGNEQPAPRTTGREQRDRSYPLRGYGDEQSWSSSPAQDLQSPAGRAAYTDNWREQAGTPANGIPIVDRRPPAPAKRRDADGQYGEQPPVRAAQPSPAAQRRIDDWVDRSTPDPSRVLQTEMAGTSAKSQGLNDYATARPLQEGPGPGLEFSNSPPQDPRLGVPFSSDERRPSTSSGRGRAPMPAKDAEW